MTTVPKGKKRPVGRPTNASSNKASRSNTLTNIFATTSIETKEKPKKQKSTKVQRLKYLSLDTESSDDSEEAEDDNTPVVPMKDITETNAKSKETAAPSVVDMTDTTTTIKTTIIEDDSITKTNSEDPEILDIEDPATPTQTNSVKKRDIQRRTRGKKKPVQRTLFDKDTRSFKCMNVFNTRFDLSFRVPASDKPPEEAQKQIQEFLNACNDNSDGLFVILQWKVDDATKYPMIKNGEQVPSQLSRLRIYFPRIRLSQKGNLIYTSVYLGYDCSVENFLTDISFWLTDSGFKLYKKSIQAENSAILGWFLYGIREINMENLQNAIKDTLGSPIVGLRQMRIRTSVTGKASPIRAMGIECNATQETEIKSCLNDLYHSKQNYWPMGIKLRYMRDARFLCGTQAINKTVHLLGRHQRFQEGIMVRRTRDLLSLDIVDGEHKKSLRMILMTIKSKTKPSMSVFHSIDPVWNQQDTHNVIFLPGFEIQAEQVLCQLVPYVIHLEGEYVENFFSIEALSKSEGCIWNEEKGCATSAINTELDDIEMLDEENDIGNPSKPSNILDLTKVRRQT